MLTVWFDVAVILWAWMHLISGEWRNVRSLRGEWMCISLVLSICFVSTEWMNFASPSGKACFLFSCSLHVHQYTYSLCAEKYFSYSHSVLSCYFESLTFSCCGNVLIACRGILLILMCPLCSSETKGCQHMFSSADFLLGRILYVCFLRSVRLSLHGLLFWDQLVNDFLSVLFSLEFVSAVQLLVCFVLVAVLLAENLWWLVVFALLLAEWLVYLLAEQLAVLLMVAVRCSFAAEFIEMTEIR